MNDLRFLFRFESSPQYEGQYINSMYTLLKHQLHASSCFFLNIPSKCPLSNQHNLWKIKKFISAKAKGNTFGLKEKELNFCDENNTFYCLPTTYIDSVDHKLHLDSTCTSPVPKIRFWIHNILKFKHRPSASTP